MLPTFDFGNLVRKIVSGVVTTACNPVTATIAAAATFGNMSDEISQIFGFSIPQISLPTFDIITEGQDYFALLYYAIDGSTLFSLLTTTVNFLNRLISFGIVFFPTLMTLVISIGAYKVLRVSLKDYFT